MHARMAQKGSTRGPAAGRQRRPQQGAFPRKRMRQNYSAVRKTPNAASIYNTGKMKAMKNVHEEMDNSEDDNGVEEEADVNGENDSNGEVESESGHDEGNPEEVPSAKKRKSKSKDSHTHNNHPPQVPLDEGLLNVSQTNELFYSHLFKLQCDELLAEIRLPYEKLTILETMLVKLKETLLSSSSFQHKFVYHKKNVQFKLPFHIYTDLPVLDPFTFTFEPPSRVEIVGSYLLQSQLYTSARQVVIDIAVVVPSSLFTNTDFFDFQYYFRRASYLSAIEKSLQKSLPKIKSLANAVFRYEWVHGLTYKPILNIHVNHSQSKLGTVEFVFRVIPNVKDDLFPSTKLALSRNNVRDKIGDPSLEERRMAKGNVGKPTPVYNCSILEDMSSIRYFYTLHALFQTVENARSALQLFMVWAKRRGLVDGELSKSSTLSCSNSYISSGFDQVTPFLLKILLLHLYETDQISADMSSYHIFRKMQLALSYLPFSTTGIILGKQTTSLSLEDKAALEAAKSYFPLVFLDPINGMNLFAFVSNSAYKKLIYFVKQTASIIAQSNINAMDVFSKLFLTSMDYFQTFDLYAHVSLPSSPKFDVARTTLPTLLLPVLIAHHAESVLETALTDRVEVAVITPYVESNSLKIGINVTEHASRILDVGPPADSLDSVSFRSFWGEKSELRRFKDGRISEAVMWPLSTSTLSVVRSIITYVLSRHCQIPPSGISYVAHQLDPFLNIRPDISSKLTSSPQSTNGQLHAAFTKLSSQLRALSLPIGISSLVPQHAAFRQTDPFPPQPLLTSPSAFSTITARLQHCQQCIVTHLQFETSSQWPDDIAAINAVKSAFYLSLSNAYWEQFGGRTQAQSSELSIHPILATDYVDIFVDGYFFRIVIVYEKEKIIYEATLKQLESNLMEESASPKDISLFRSQVAFWKKRFVHTPYVQQYLRHFASECASFSNFAHIAKRWCSSNWYFDRCGGHDVLDQLCYAIFKQSSQSTFPYTSVQSLHRFLTFLTVFDFETTPLMISLKGDPLHEDWTSKVESKFIAKRRNRTGAAIYISSEIDEESEIFTNELPSKQTLQEMIASAKASKSELEELLEAFGELPESKWIHLMKSSDVSQFDAIIVLKKDCLPIHHLQTAISDEYDSNETIPGGEINSAQTKLENTISTNKTRFKPPPPSSKGNQKNNLVKPAPIIGLHSLHQYISLLRTHFGYFAEFLVDFYGGTQIGLRWHELKSHTKWTAHESGYSIRAQKTGMVENKCNYGELLRDMSKLGAGLVQDILVKDENKWSTLPSAL